MIPTVQLGQVGLTQPQTGDADFGSVVLLIQGGADGSTTLTDLSSYGGTAAITTGAQFSSGQTVFGNNMVAGDDIIPNVAAFTSSGAGSRFTRPSGEDWTIEAYVRWNSLANTSPSGMVFDWIVPGSTRLAALRLSGSTGVLQFINGTNGPTSLGTITADVTHFVQITISGNTVAVDVDGVEALSEAMSAHSGAGTYSFYVAASQTPNATASTWWASPLRATKGVARARAVPTDAFPTS